jgi:hypothetical protein
MTVFTSFRTRAAQVIRNPLFNFNIMEWTPPNSNGIEVP